MSVKLKGHLYVFVFCFLKEKKYLKFGSTASPSNLFPLAIHNEAKMFYTLYIPYCKPAYPDAYRFA